ncbi:UDP-sugar pyrophospharylase [Morus notabilis]|uniref:UDP-sugar pyrophospharylase n=1 Tax=Morus notabilis TaxID=981085 RepID=W9QCQ5_9ROSA|nr:UDP-sugar pyrophospharylase [Morus notabilis]
MAVLCQIELAKTLLELGQSHLFEHWAEPGVEDEEKKAFFDQVARLNSSYPGGLASYIKTARELLADSKTGKNPFEGFTPSVPAGEVLTFGDDDFVKFEETGIKEVRKAAFVLVAGGLGERLGYNGIKEKVACLDDNEARLAVDPHSKYKIQAIPAAIGVSATRQYHVNSLAVPRKAKEAIGGITRLTHVDGIQYFPFPCRQTQLFFIFYFFVLLVSLELLCCCYSGGVNFFMDGFIY